MVDRERIREFDDVVIEDTSAGAELPRYSSSTFLPEPFEAQGKAVAEPHGELGVIGKIIAGFRVHQNRKILPVERHPGHQFGEHIRFEGNLIEANRMRTERLVMPAAKHCIEARADAPPQPRSGFLGVGVVIYVGVIALDFRSLFSHSDESSSRDADVNSALS